MTNSPFVCIKLQSGETLFAEVISNTKEKIRVLHPMLTKTSVMQNKQDGFMLSNWIPWVDEVEFDISLFQIIYIGALKEMFIKFYGSNVIKEEFNKINARGFARVEDGENPKVVTAEIVEEMRNLLDLYSMKYNLDSDEFKERFSLDEIDTDTDTKKVLH